jgi:tRNA (guanine-N7-)-methyltransferase
MAESTIIYRQNYLIRLYEENQEILNSPILWLLHPDNLPISPRSDYPTYRRYFLEIGFGHGEVLEELLKKHPDVLFIGIERRPYRVRKALKRVHRIGAPNARLIRVNLDLVDDPIFVPETFDEILINHPDPWPKPRQDHHRFFTTARVSWLADLLSPGGTIEVASDHTEYFFHILHLFEGESRLESDLPPPFYTPWSEPDRPVSRYERNRRAEGATVRLLRYFKK